MNSKSNKKFKSVFEFKDVTKYFDYIRRESELSYVQIGEQCGVNFSTLHKVMNGNVTSFQPERVYPVAKYIGLSFREIYYFSLLCQLKIKNSRKVRSMLLEQLEELRQQEVEVVIGDDAYLSDIDLYAIREVACFKDSDGSIAFIRSRLLFDVPVTKVKEALKFLQMEGFIASTGPKKPFKVIKKMVISAPTSSQQMIREQQLETLKRTMDVFSKPMKEKDPSQRMLSVSFGLNEKGLNELNELIDDFKLGLRQIIKESDDSMDSAHQINLQSFSLTQKT